MKRSDRWLTAAVALAIGLIEPHVELAWKCREGYVTSEACVWGRAYFPLAQILAPVIFSPLLFGAWLLLTRLMGRK
jgi:hypothetical protein